MANRLFVILTCMTLALYGCGSNAQFAEFSQNEKQQWDGNDAKYFMFNNKSSHTNGDLFMILNYINLDHKQYINIEMEVQTPSKKVWSKSFTIPLETTSRKDRVNSNREIRLIENCKFSEIGVYKFKLKQTSLPSINGILTVGIAIK
ncbi:MAG: hypothetical protein RR277_07175 [Rikenellaceae bacterium]